MMGRQVSAAMVPHSFAICIKLELLSSTIKTDTLFIPVAWGAGLLCRWVITVHLTATIYTLTGQTRFF